MPLVHDDQHAQRGDGGGDSELAARTGLTLTCRRGDRGETAEAAAHVGARHHGGAGDRTLGGGDDIVAGDASAVGFICELEKAGRDDLGDVAGLVLLGEVDGERRPLDAEAEWTADTAELGEGDGAPLVAFVAERREAVAEKLRPLLDTAPDKRW